MYTSSSDCKDIGSRDFIVLVCGKDLIPLEEKSFFTLTIFNGTHFLKGTVKEK